MAWIRVAEEAQVAVDDMQCFTIEDESITVYHLADGWYATADTCTHQDCSLVEGDIENTEIVCWCHGGAFDIKSGKATRMPCVTPLETFPVRIQDGFIEVDFV